MLVILSSIFFQGMKKEQLLSRKSRSSQRLSALSLHRQNSVHSGRTHHRPPSGLHPADIQHLLLVLNRLVDSGNTVVVIEHNLDVIKTADYLVDIGPEGGDGQVVACGTPEEVAAVAESFTGRFLRQVLVSS